MQEAFTAQEEDAIRSLGEDANLRDIALLRSQNGFGFGPLKDGEVIKPEDYDKLDEQEKACIKAANASPPCSSVDEGGTGQQSGQNIRERTASMRLPG